MLYSEPLSSDYPKNTVESQVNERVNTLGKDNRMWGDDQLQKILNSALN